jgi:hypothetical protein
MPDPLASCLHTCLAFNHLFFVTGSVKMYTKLQFKKWCEDNPEATIQEVIDEYPQYSCKMM